MAAEKLPDNVDLVILGTGMTESLIAAAFARIGYSVLHLDGNNYYGGDWASFNLETVKEWAASKKVAAKIQHHDSPNEGEKLVIMENAFNSIKDIQLSIHAAERSPSSKTSANGDQAEPAKPTEQGETTAASDNADADASVAPKNTDANVSTEVSIVPELEPTSPVSGSPETSSPLTWDDIARDWRKFGIDLIPKVLYSRGALVDLLISSDVSKYCEFRTVNRILTLRNGVVEKVPCSRTDVFESASVSLIEKRMLMKFMEFCLTYDKHPEEYASSAQTPFAEFLRARRLTQNLAHYVQHSIAMVSDNATTDEGLRAVQKFLQSVGRYGNSAFLWPLYGSGELSQAFCRMCAVFGGIYCLQCRINSLVIDADNRCTAVNVSNGQRITCNKWLIFNASQAPESLCQIRSTGEIYRCVLITDKSILPEPQEQITLLSIPRPQNQQPIALLELPSISLVCPRNLYVVHLTTSGSVGGNAQHELESAVKQLFTLDSETEVSGDSSSGNQTKPRVLWSLYFTMSRPTVEPHAGASLPTNSISVSGPDAALDFDASVAEARAIFEQLCPGNEFIPKAPNPEDIIWDDGGVQGSSQSGDIANVTDTLATAAVTTDTDTPDSIASETNDTVAKETSEAVDSDSSKTLNSTE